MRRRCLEQHRRTSRRSSASSITNFNWWSGKRRSSRFSGPRSSRRRRWRSRAAPGGSELAVFGDTDSRSQWKIGLHRARGFHRDVESGLFQTRGELADLTLQQRFATGHDHVPDAGFHGLGHQVPDRSPVALRQPRGVRRVAPPAAEVAARRADKERRHPGQDPLALKAGEGLGDEHAAYGTTIIRNRDSDFGFRISDFEFSDARQLRFRTLHQDRQTSGAAEFSTQLTVETGMTKYCQSR